MNELLIICIVIVIYAKSMGFDIINTWEDCDRVVKIPSFKVIKGGTYQPLRELSFWLDQKIWKDNKYWSFGGHLQNILWYIGTCLVVYWILEFILGKGEVI